MARIDNSQYQCIVSYTNCGVTTKSVLRTFKTRAAAQNWCDRYNSKPGPNGFAAVSTMAVKAVL